MAKKWQVKNGNKPAAECN